MDSDDQSLKTIRSGLLGRSQALTQLVLGTGSRVFRWKLGSKGNRAKLLSDQALQMVQQLGELKGGMMKVGQMLSVYGENFLAPEINMVLKQLQSSSPPVRWESMKDQWEKEIPLEQQDLLAIDPVPRASASIGQVYRARHKRTGDLYAIKIQYPKMKDAIANDLKILKSLFSVVELFPSIPHLDIILEEIGEMMVQELDYRKEAELHLQYKEKLGVDSRFVVPAIFPAWSSDKVLTTSWEEGLPVDSSIVAGLSQERRNRLAESILDLYLKELFEWGFVQTDPHFGNYRIRINDGGADQWVLFDFGASRFFDKDFIMNYRRLIQKVLGNEKQEFLQVAFELKFLSEDDPAELKEMFYQFCDLMVEPFRSTSYDFGNSDLPQRLVPKIAEVLKKFSARVPPREVVFLDRKTTGVFVILSRLKANLNPHALLEKYLL